jgi:hypothetical protein
MGAIGKKLLLELGEDTFHRSGILWERLSKELCQGRWAYIRKHRFLFNVLQIISQQIHHPVPNFAKLARVHESS